MEREVGRGARPRGHRGGAHAACRRRVYVHAHVNGHVACTCTCSVHAARVQGACTLLEEAARAVVGAVADRELLPGLEVAARAQREGAAAGREVGGGVGGVLAEVEEGDEGERVLVVRHREAATRHLLGLSGPCSGSQAGAGVGVRAGARLRVRHGEAA